MNQISEFVSENSEQIKAITHESGIENLVIIAGPGTGKTRVIIKRLYYLAVHKRIDPKNILVVTFTNRAINEIMGRMKMDNDYALIRYDMQFAGTLHSISKKLLTKYKDKLAEISQNKYQSVNILDETEAYFVMLDWWTNVKQLERDNLDGLSFATYIRNTKHYGYIRWHKNDPHTFTHRLYGDEKAITDIALLKEGFEHYQKYMLKNKRMDFEDLLIWFHQLLIHEETGLRKECQENFLHILVDEFQDMNGLQLDILRELSGKNYNMCCVGDPNQAIYSFQGAHPKIFHDLKDMYPNHIVEVKLVENYRSTQKIIDLSNKSIAINEPENKVNIFTTTKDNGDNITVFNIISTKNEKTLLIKKINELKDSGILLKNIAILYRSNWISEKFKLLFIKEGIKFIDYNSSKALNNIVSHTVICFANLYFSKDSFSVKFLLEFYTQEGKIIRETLKKISSLTQKHKGCWYKSLFKVNLDVLENDDKIFLTKLQDLIKLLNSQKHEYKDMVVNSENLPWFMQELTGKISRFLDIKNLNIYLRPIYKFFKKIFKNKFYIWQAEIKIKDFLISALSYVKFFRLEQDDDCLNISTIHSAKGCEFDYVFLIGVTENIMPSSYAVIEKETQDKFIRSTIEEERRMFYVGITRAKSCLYLFHAEQKKSKNIKNKQSRFIGELKSNEKINYLQEFVIDSNNVYTFGTDIDQQNTSQDDKK